MGFESGINYYLCVKNALATFVSLRRTLRRTVLLICNSYRHPPFQKKLAFAQFGKWSLGVRGAVPPFAADWRLILVGRREHWTNVC